MPQRPQIAHNVGTAALLFGGILLLVLGPPLFTDDATPSASATLATARASCAGRSNGATRDRPFVYFLQPLVGRLCARAAPRRRARGDCAFEAAPTATKRACSAAAASRRTARAHSLTCLPVDPALAATADAWMSRHVLDELAAQTLRASGVTGAWRRPPPRRSRLLLLRWLPITLLLLVLGALGSPSRSRPRSSRAAARSTLTPARR